MNLHMYVCLYRYYQIVTAMLTDENKITIYVYVYIVNMLFSSFVKQLSDMTNLLKDKVFWTVFTMYYN